MTLPPGFLRTAPLNRETTWSLICRIAGRYGLEAAALRSCWKWRSHQPRHDGGGGRADAEVLLNTAGRQLLAGLCGVEEGVLARALPSWGREDARLPAGDGGEPVAAWRTGGAVAGPVAFGCRLCTAGRTGTAGRAVLYAPRWKRVCVRHGRWLLDADADQPHEYVDVRRLPEVVAAQRRWAGVARRAVRAGAEPERMFALAHAVVARWWEQALHWEREKVWPRRLHRVAGGDAGGDLEWWRIVGRDAVIFPEVVAVADALLDPGMGKLVWVDSGRAASSAMLLAHLQQPPSPASEATTADEPVPTPASVPPLRRRTSWRRRNASRERWSHLGRSTGRTGRTSWTPR
ncbi:hypothetical protein [Streptomyces sp. f150]|uniref:hypothetical protein n=1 Tax=Streptomyces sp. f150 TaxID=1827699 RepID=UPI00211D2ACD|nr:hypothetical protein [Streptomyces sp. f150]